MGGANLNPPGPNQVAVLVGDVAAPQARVKQIPPQPRAERRHPRGRIAPARHLPQVSEMLTEGTLAKEPAASIMVPIRRERLYRRPLINGTSQEPPPCESVH